MPRSHKVDAVRVTDIGGHALGARLYCAVDVASVPVAAVGTRTLSLAASTLTVLTVPPVNQWMADHRMRSWCLVSALGCSRSAKLECLVLLLAAAGDESDGGTQQCDD